MAKSKKPRHQQRVKAVHVPMMPESRSALAMQLHAAVETLIERPSIDACNGVSKKLATLAQAGAKNDSLDIATEIINAVVDRFERVKKIGVSDKEAAMLRLMAGDLDVLLPTIPVNLLKASAAMVNHNFDMMQGE
jgi:hypothetical protein